MEKPAVLIWLCWSWCTYWSNVQVCTLCNMAAISSTVMKVCYYSCATMPLAIKCFQLTSLPISSWTVRTSSSAPKSRSTGLSTSRSAATPSGRWSARCPESLPTFRSWFGTFRWIRRPALAWWTRLRARSCTWTGRPSPGPRWPRAHPRWTRTSGDRESKQF